MSKDYKKLYNLEKKKNEKLELNLLEQAFDKLELKNKIDELEEELDELEENNYDLEDELGELDNELKEF
jgi:polyhydroxyalkanoate synthesis regulator phasin